MPALWDEHDIADFFLFEAKPLDLADEQGTLYTADDGCLKARVLLLPARRLVAITVQGGDESIVVDLAVSLRSPLERRFRRGTEILYCHECVVVPGVKGYERLEWYTYFEHIKVAGPLVSMLFACRPSIRLQFLDPSPDNRAW